MKTKFLLLASLSFLVAFLQGCAGPGHSLKPSSAEAGKSNAVAAMGPDHMDHSQHMQHMQHGHHNMTDMPGMQHDDQSNGDSDHMGHSDHSMSSQFGGHYQSMAALGSGTALLPADSPSYMWHFTLPGLSDQVKQNCMAHGELKLSFDHQGGPRGVSRWQSQNWLMGSCEFALSGDTAFFVRGMITLEPFTSPAGGFPQLFQSGETYRGNEIVDAQHPHNLISELAVGFTQRLTEDLRYYFYFGFPGDREEGPTAFMHRPSALDNPAVPLCHHCQDAGHITNGVVSMGLDWDKFRLGMSVFHGGEPGENRLTVDVGGFDSYSWRLQYAPDEHWVLGTSFGLVHNPEPLHPGDVKRYTAFAEYSQRFDGGYLAASAVFGHNQEAHGTLSGGLIETSVNFADRHYVYGRAEYVSKGGLIDTNVYGKAGLSAFDGGAANLAADLSERNSLVGAFTLGYAYDVYQSPMLRVGLGADVTFYDVPSELKNIYGDPVSFMLNLRVRPGRMF